MDEPNIENNAVMEEAQENPGDDRPDPNQGPERDQLDMEISQENEEQKDHRKVSELEEGEIRSDSNLSHRNSDIVIVEKPHLLWSSLKSSSKASATESISRTVS